VDVLREKQIKNEKSVLIMTVDGEGKVYLQEQGKKYMVFRLDWEERVW
jgi:hypothetical protein